MKDQAIQYLAFDVHQATGELSLRDASLASLERGIREELAKVTLARRIASVTLRLWKKGGLWDPNKLTTQATWRPGSKDDRRVRVTRFGDLSRSGTKVRG